MAGMCTNNLDVPNPRNKIVPTAGYGNQQQAWQSADPQQQQQQWMSWWQVRDDSICNSKLEHDKLIRLNLFATAAAAGLGRSRGQ